MSLYYKESNDEDLVQLFNKKLIYRSDVLRVSPQNVVDFHFGEKYLYGRVGLNYVPIYLFSKSNLKSFKTKSGESDLKAVNFVVDNFEAMATQFKKRAQMGTIDSTDEYLSNLKIYKAYEDPEVVYTNYLSAYFNAIVETFKTENSKILNFEQFITAFLTYLQAVTDNKLPFTMPAFVKSKLCPLSVSGLVIEIADLKHSNDDQKIKQFVESKNWSFYVNTCNTYGFMVDMNAPWRLVADLDTVSMLAYAFDYGMPSMYAIFSKLYRSPALKSFNNLKLDLLRMYNQVKPTQALFDDGCTRKIVTPVDYTVESLEATYSEQYFLKLYFNIRFMEEESKFSDVEKNKLITEALQIYNFSGKARTIAIFERILNKTFDYRGSMSYLMGVIKKTRDGETAEEDAVIGEGTGVITGGAY